MKNTTLLDALANRRMFILYRVERREDGKTDKLPTNPTTGDNLNGQDPSHWMQPHEALQWAYQWNLARPAGVESYGVGIVIYEGCGVFALDFDYCREASGGWMPHVINFEGRFRGAYAETSLSGKGRHVFGSYAGAVPPHGVKNKTYRMEAYTKARFIALTGEDVAGSVLTDCTKALGAFLAEFFPENPEPEHGVEWTTAPVASWRGPTDDAQLIARAIRSISARAVFGGGAAFGDLWRADAEILAKAFPSQNSHSAWDGSAADQALANHLAFWTGNDCERMLRLMWQSGLVRDKWNRADYLPRTILGATGTQREWYIEKEPAERSVTPLAVGSTATTALGADTPDQALQAAPSPVPAPPGVPPPPTVPSPPGTVTIELAVPSPPASAEKPLKPGELPPVGEYCNIHMMRQMFEGYCYVRDIHAIQLPDGSTTTKERFDSMFGGPQYAMTADGQKPTKSAWDAYTLSEIYRFPRVDTQYFKPGVATGTIREREGRKEINSYRPAEVRSVKGDPAPFLDLVQRMLPEGRDAQILLSYMAACCRNLGSKFSWCVFLQGAKGNGKTTVAKVLEYCLSLRYTHWAKADQLGEKFNSVFVDKLLVVVDEMYSDDTRELQEILKQLVTADRIEVRPMYAEKTMKEVCFNMMLISNHQNGVRIDLDERRYAPLFCAQQSKADRIRDGLDNAYFLKLRKWLWGNDAEGAAIVYDYLMSFDIPDEFNPATECIVAPFTTSTELAATASLGGVEQELVEAIKQEHEGFRNGWISSQAVDFLLARCGKDKAIPRNARKNLVTSLGYTPHPSLGAEGMLSVPMPDGARPRLYVQKGHPWAVDYLSPEQVKQGFIDAQKRS
jgi:hypothetical protein